MKKKYKLFFFIGIFSFFFSGCTQTLQPEKEEQQQEQKGTVIQENANEIELEKEPVSEKIGGNLPVSRALAAKMICLAFHDNAEIASMDNEITFIDVSEEDWFYPYINMMGIEGYMKGSGETFQPLEPLSLFEAQVLIDKMNPNNKTKIKITDDTKNKPISYSLWCELYQKTLKELSKEKTIAEEFELTEKELIIFSTPANGDMDSWHMATDQGIYSFSGYAMDAYVDKKVKFLVKGQEIVEAMEIVEKSPVLEGAYLQKQEGNKIAVFMGGAWRDFTYHAVIEETFPCIADLKLENGQITEMAFINEKKSGIVKKSDAGCIELEKDGELKIRTNVKIYEENKDQVNWKGIRHLICGADTADYYLKNEEICAAVIRRDAFPEKIRIVLSQTGFTGYLHDSVTLSFQGDYLIKNRTGQKQIQSGEKLVLTKEDTQGLFSENRIILVPQQKENKITIESISRGGGAAPAYLGNIEIEKRANGFVILNETEMETYLCGVVPSEMPASYGVEAAKVQAVTARSYAHNQYYANKYFTYGANVDDSTQCQVYNNTKENETSSQGVKETEGICLTYQGEIISANFFSTSGGSRANSGEVWADMGSKKFPAFTPEYASAGKEYTKGDYGDLSTEENASAFFKDWTVEGYDKESGWFRWKVQLSAEELNAIIKANLKTAYNRNHFLVKTLQSNGVYRSRAIEDIGEITDIRVGKRGQGGNAMELVIKGTKKEVLVMTEYNIRKVLAPVQKLEGKNPIVISCINGVQMENYSMMPSAFFAIEKDISPEGKLLSVTFYGGGNGHGVGMSQNGVRGLLKEGYTYDEIVKHYFKGTELTKKTKKELN